MIANPKFSFSFDDFLSDSHVKLSKCHTVFKTRSITKNSNNLYVAIIANVLKKFASDWMKTVGEVAF